MFGPMRYGPSAPVGLPVREVADLDDDRHADLIDGERQRLLVDLHVGHLDRRQRHRLDRLDRLDDVDLAARVAGLTLATLEVDLHGDPLPLGGAVVGRHRGPLLGVLEPARAELEVALTGVARTAL